MARHTLLILLISLGECLAQSLRVATFNTWSGLTYSGTFLIGSHESESENAARNDIFLQGIRNAAPDVLALQEVNPSGSMSQRIADELGYSVISQRVLSGIKLGPVGIPCNMNEGLAILARPELGLEFVDVLPLSPNAGMLGDVLSFHLGEQNAALIGAIRTERGDRVIIINTHLPSFPDDSPHSRELLRAICRTRGYDDDETAVWLGVLTERQIERTAMIDRIIAYLGEHVPDTPAVLMGDFNLPGTSTDIRTMGSLHGYTDISSGYQRPIVTWDGINNPLTRFSSTHPLGDEPTTPIEELARDLDGEQRDLDHIFFRSPHTPPVVSDVRRIMDTPSEGPFASDHFGLMATIGVSDSANTLPRVVATREYLPMFSYDTDVGFGYGAKVFFLDQFGSRESVDLILFNSTKGERWYRLVFSIPDFELRQGTVYPLAIDITLDYDKYLKNVFFGVGPESHFDNKEVYTREPFEAQVLFSRGVSERTVVQGGFRYRRIRNSNFADSSAIPLLSTSQSVGTATALSVQTSVRHDTRDSFINPSRGFVLEAEAEYAPSIGNVSFLRMGAAVQYYATLMYPKTIFAFRLSGQSIEGSEAPLQFLLPLGGNRTLRGFPQDRFLGRTSLVSNLELRFPLIWRFGGILGWDTGNIWMSPSEVSLSAWRSNAAVGLRFFMDTFIVRADLGFSSETTGFYLNFGHVF